MQDVTSVHSIYTGATEKAKYRLEKKWEEFWAEARWECGGPAGLERRDGNGASSGRGRWGSAVRQWWEVEPRTSPQRLQKPARVHGILL